MAKGQKYALLTLPVDSDEGERGELDASTRTWVGSVQDHIDPAELTVWRTDFGSDAWDRAEQKQRLVMSVMESERPAVQDAENNLLARRLERTWKALLLAAPLRPFYGDAWILTGQLQAQDRIGDSRGLHRMPTIIRPFYASRSTFWQNMPWQNGDNWFTRLLDVDLLLAGSVSAPGILQHAVGSLIAAMRMTELEFRIPDFVRAAECVVALPRNNGGAQVFRDRILRLIPDLMHNWFVGGHDLGDRLARLYQYRNDCVHGKIPFEDLQANGDHGPDDAAKYEYLAEKVAHGAILFALRDTASHVHFASRTTLEQAWATGRIA